MISKNLYVQITLRVLLIVAAALLFGWTLFDQKAYVLSAFPAIILVLSTFNLIYYLNRINRRIFYFFDAIRNEDSTLSFPKNTNNKIIRNLNNSLMRVNKQIQQIYIENSKQEQYFQALLEHAATGMFTFNKEGFILHSNSLARRLFGVKVLTHLNQLGRIDKALLQTIKEIQPYEQRLVTLNNEKSVIQLLIKSNSFISDKEELMLLSVHDIKSQLDEKELDSWRKLIRVMMHEIMNSVSPITSLSESLAGYFYTDGNIKTPLEINEKTIETTIKGLELIREQGKGLISFVESYRQLTHLPKPVKKRFPVKNLIENIIILSGSFENSGQIEMSYKVTPNELKILADEKQVSQVLVNLVKNAYQANAENQNAKVKIIARMGENDRPEIGIIDNGPGIPEELLDKVFIPFFTTKETGSGIGLSLSRQIMQMHGGSLKVVSTPGRVTTASLSF